MIDTATFKYLVFGAERVALQPLNAQVAISSTAPVGELVKWVQKPLAQRVVFEAPRYIVDGYCHVCEPDTSSIKTTRVRWENWTQSAEKCRKLFAILTPLLCLVALAVYVRQGKSWRNIKPFLLVVGSFLLEQLFKIRKTFAEDQVAVCRRTINFFDLKAEAESFAKRRIEAYSASFEELHLHEEVLLPAERDARYVEYFKRFFGDFLRAYRAGETPTGKNSWVKDFLKKEEHPLDSYVIAKLSSEELKEKIERTKQGFKKVRTFIKNSKNQRQAEQARLTQLHTQLKQKVDEIREYLERNDRDKQGLAQFFNNHVEPETILKKIAQGRDLVAEPLAIYYEYVKEFVTRAADALDHDPKYEGMDMPIFNQLPQADCETLTSQMKTTLVAKMKLAPDLIKPEFVTELERAFP